MWSHHRTCALTLPLGNDLEQRKGETVPLDLASLLSTSMLCGLIDRHVCIQYAILNWESGDVAASAWLDNKVVTVMYAVSSPLEETTVQRMQKKGSRLSFSCPEALSSYLNMRGVDREDQLRGYYHHRMKSRKYYRLLDQ